MIVLTVALWVTGRLPAVTTATLGKKIQGLLTLDPGAVALERPREMPPLVTIRDSKDAMPRILCSSLTYVYVLINHGLCFLIISSGIGRHSRSSRSLYYSRQA